MDGPLAPIEFTRQSLDGRVTLVIDRSAAPVRLLWAQMTTTDLSRAKESLRDREQLTAKEWSSLIGSWQRLRSRLACGSGPLGDDIIFAL